MFNRIDIERFRGIKDCRIDGLNRVNLFLGKNNCGKSSVLDAVFLVAGMSNPVLPITINSVRNYQKSNKSDMLLNFYALDSSIPITVKAYNENTRELSISLMESSVSTIDVNDLSIIGSTDTEKRFGLVSKFKINDRNYSTSIVFSNPNEQPKQKLSSEYKEDVMCSYITPKNDLNISVEAIAGILENKDEDFVVDALKLIEPKLMDFTLSGDVILVDVGYDKRIPINMMGDGMRKLLSIIAGIYYSKNGIVLIDEISNGFHHSVMTGLWKAVISAAIRNNVQIFATTHDLDSIKGLRDAAIDSSSRNEISCFKLQKMDDGRLTPYHYSLDSVDYSINQDIEIR